MSHFCKTHPRYSAKREPNNNCVGLSGESEFKINEGGVMRKIIEEVSGEGLEKLLGERVTLFCGNYIYTGLLAGVNGTCVLLTNAAIVYETGPLTDGKWKDAQPLPGDWYVQLGWVESFGVLK